MAIAKVNLTGTHIQHGFLKVRIDLYPNPSDKTYSIHYVDKPNRPYTEEELADESLRDLVPTHKELNPCLCHFITIDEGTTKQELRQIIKQAFDINTFQELDNKLSAGQSVSQLMNSKRGRGKELRIGKEAQEALTKSINIRFTNMEIKV